jgi:tol-pal system protein YbgF
LKTLNPSGARLPLTILAAALAFGVATPTLVSAAMFSTPPANVGRVTNDAAPARMLVAQSADTAQLMVRLQQLEEQNRLLNGQIEGLTFQLTQMQELVNRMAEDNEFRFQALEGGTSPKTDAATQAGGVMQPEVLPQDPANTAEDLSGVPMTVIPAQGVKPLPGEIEFDPTFTDAMPMDSLGVSGDPLVGTGAQGGLDLVTGEPLNLSYDPAAADTGNPDADAQFAAGFEAISAGDYAFAEDQFSQFVELYPDNVQATEAANLLGDALLYRQAYSEAADVLLNAFQKAPDNPRAPDLLLKLGMALSGAGERETACRTLSEIDKRFSNLSPVFVSRLAEEKVRAECPPA